ncbi:hypothetical protein, partial [Mycobacterium avium]|uniref:hypothetical protein n=1 Tax=Mycobacterium avium TaxID=1764 RepID=UPI001CE16DEB
RGPRSGLGERHQRRRGGRRRGRGGGGGLPAQPLPNQQHTPSLLAMVPGLPPLPNFSFLQH